MKKRFLYYVILFLFTACHSQKNSSPFSLNKENVEEIHIQSPFQNLKIFRENGNWRGRFLPAQTSDPQQELSFRSYPFDPEKVETLLDTFLETPSQKNTPRSASSIFLEIKTPQENKSWIISNEDPLRRIALKPSTDWRNKQIFNEDSSHVEEITLLEKNQKITLSRNEEGEWVWKEKAQQNLNQEWIESLARKLARLKAINVGEHPSADESGLEKPLSEVLVKFRGQNTPFHVLLGNKTGQDLYYAKVEGLPDWQNEIFTVNQETAEKLMSKSSQLKWQEKK